MLATTEVPSAQSFSLGEPIGQMERSSGSQSFKTGNDSPPADLGLSTDSHHTEDTSSSANSTEAHAKGDEGASSSRSEQESELRRRGAKGKSKPSSALGVAGIDADVDAHDDEAGDKDDGAKAGSKSGSVGKNNGSVLAGAREMLQERMKSPLMGSINLEDFRENLAKNVEVKFAPLHIPSHRRLQTAAVALWELLLPICLFFFLLLMSFPRLWVVLVPYLIWIQFDRAPVSGGRPKKWARNFFLWKYFAQYYPCSIVKEADLPPDRPYLFGYHPHGIIGMGAFASFATEGTHFSKHFPGINPHLLTLGSNFKIPFYRDFMLFHGVCSVSKASCTKILEKGAGTAITIVIGGAAESLSAHPGTADLTLKRRFGFIKIAIREGADLVPVFSFGENDIFDQLANHKGSLLYKLQKKFQKVFGFTLPLFYGRGIFNYSYGLMPFRHPIVAVFGSPIKVKRDPNPSDEVVQELQQQYIDELMRIWDKYKDVYARNRTKELTLVA